MSERSGKAGALPRPRWGGLYAVAGIMLATLASAQLLVTPGAELTMLQCGIVVAGFGAMVRWTRRNRAALDRLDWCHCASARMTVRVVPSYRRERARIMRADTPMPLEVQTPIEVEPEEVAR